MLRWMLPLAVAFSCVLPYTAMGQSVDPSKWDEEDDESATDEGEKKAEGEAKPEAEWKTLKTGFRMAKKFSFTLPPVNMQTAGMNVAVPDGHVAISTRLPLPSKALTTTVDGRKLGIDLNGDLKPDEWCKGKYLVQQVVLEYADGTKAPYGVRIDRGSKNFTMSRSCYRYFSFGGQRITLIDNNSDGYYDTFGKDAMIVGRGSYAQYLSSMISIRGKVYEMKLNRAGTEVSLRRWQGQTGKVVLAQGWKGRGKLAAALLVDGNRCFNAAAGTVIPVGNWRLTWGVVVAGGRMCHFKGDGTCEVKADDGHIASVDFGKKFKVDFTVSKMGVKITLPASNIKIHDDTGYEYYNFNRRLLPYVQVRDKETKETVSKGKVGTG